ncbi:MAG: hypothetical protein HPY71_00040 [Firmicutes bacterium]|nr:hypothetical protein [Bacillota bacterium]
MQEYRPHLNPGFHIPHGPLNLILPSSSFEDILQWILLAIHQVRDNRVNPVPMLELAKLLLIYPINVKRTYVVIPNIRELTNGNR